MTYVIDEWYYWTILVFLCIINIYECIVTLYLFLCCYLPMWYIYSGTRALVVVESENGVVPPFKVYCFWVHFSFYVLLWYGNTEMNYLYYLYYASYLIKPLLFKWSELYFEAIKVELLFLNFTAIIWFLRKMFCVEKM